MNNTDFRNLVANTPSHPSNASSPSTSRPSKTPKGTSLGSKARSSIPMTPRSVQGHNTQTEFARQLAEQRGGSQFAKKFRSSAAPKGVKVASGYVDRARERREREGKAETDDVEQRIKALEEQMQLGQIDPATFNSLQRQLRGAEEGDDKVEALKKQLLERADQPGATGGQGQQDATDDAFDELEARDVAPVRREETIKRGVMAPPPRPVAGVKRSRADILAELKAQRKQAEAAKSAIPAAGFTKVKAQQEPTSRIECDDVGREVLITTDASGRVKRKVRKVNPKPSAPEATEPAKELSDEQRTPSGDMGPPPPPTATAKTSTDLTPQVSDQSRVKDKADENKDDDDEDEDEDIFADAGDEYDPFKAAEGGADDDDEDAFSGDDGEAKDRTTAKEAAADESSEGEQSEHDKPAATAAAPIPPKAKRNYFGAPEAATEPDRDRSAPFKDPTILAALKRASAVAARQSRDDSEDDDDADEKRKKPSTAAERLLNRRDRDMDDMDLGFGASRGEDEEDADEEGPRIRLSEWRGMGGEDDEDGAGGDGKKERGGANARKRGKKKRKGDKDSAADVLRVMQDRSK